MMGGRIAEELVFGQQTTGAGNDLEKATELARKMVCEWGMSEKLGPAHLRQEGRERSSSAARSTQHQDYSEETARAIDTEVRRIVMEGYATAHKLLSEGVDQLKVIAEALLEHETIDGPDIDRLLEGKHIERRPPPRPPAVKATDVKEKRPSLFSPPTLTTPEPEKA